MRGSSLTGDLRGPGRGVAVVTAPPRSPSAWREFVPLPSPQVGAAPRGAAAMRGPVLRGSRRDLLRRREHGVPQVPQQWRRLPGARSGGLGHCMIWATLSSLTLCQETSL